MIKELNKLFIEACNLGKVDKLKLLIKAGANVDIQDKFGDTRLHITCQARFVNIVKILVKAGANPNIKNDNGNAPLHYETSPEIVKILIKGGADVNAKDGCGRISLHYAGDVESMKYLIKAGADINTRDDHGYTPLTLAINRWDVNFPGGNFELYKYSINKPRIDFLKEHGASE